jgi:hypothetical protein
MLLGCSTSHTLDSFLNAGGGGELVSAGRIT